MVAVAHLVRAPLCGSGGSRFDSGQPPKKLIYQCSLNKLGYEFYMCKVNMSNVADNSRIKFFRIFSRKQREEKYYERMARLEEIRKSNIDLDLNKNIKDEKNRLEQDIRILKEISLDDQDRSWND